jgi:hypothetical protein
MNVNGLHGPEDGNHQYEEEGRPSLERRVIELALLFHSWQVQAEGIQPKLMDLTAWMKDSANHDARSIAVRTAEGRQHCPHAMRDAACSHSCNSPLMAVHSPNAVH